MALSLIALLSIAFSNEALAAPTPVNATIAKDHCKTFVQTAGKVAQGTNNEFYQGETIRGWPHTTNASFFVTQKNGKTYLLQSSCVTTSAVATDAPKPQKSFPKTETLETAEASTPISDFQKLKAQFSFIGYSSKIDIIDPAQGNFTVSTQTFGVCMGGTYDKPLSKMIAFRSEACAFFASADARGSGSNPSITQAYADDRVTVIGLRSAFGLQFKTLGDGVQLGFAIPFLFDVASWNPPSDTVTVNHSSLHLLGFLLTLEATRGKFSIETEFGFLQKLTQSTFSFGIGYAL